MTASTFIGIENLHTMDQVAAAAAHNSRTNCPTHANTSRVNVVLHGSDTPVPQLLVARLRQGHIKIGLKKVGLRRKRKQSRRARIIALDVLCSVGESFFAKVDAQEWAEHCLAFLEKIFGRENILRVDLHLDERVPHVHAIVVPITPEGRLSATTFYTQHQAEVPEDLDGIRRGKTTTPFFRRLQDGFFELCHALDPTLTPPVPGGVMTHQLVSAWRAWAGKAHQGLPKLPPAKVSPPSLKDKLTPEAYALREVESFRRTVLPVLEILHAKAAQYDQVQKSNLHLEGNLRKRDLENAELSATLQEIQRRFREQQDLLADVSQLELCERFT